MFGQGSTPRPELRRPRRDEVAIYRIRVDLDDARPPIWRRLDLRSDLTLDVVHQVLQAAFSWDDYHLHRFSLGGRPFDRGSQVFLCAYDADNPEFGDDDGPEAAQVRLDETLQDPGDELHYLYDYGDNWELTLQLEQVTSALDDFPTAVLVDGGRAAPPEDCGGLTDAEHLAQVLDDPARFEPDEINRALRGTYFVMREAGVDPRLADLVHRLEPTPLGAGLVDRVARLASEPTTVDDAELRASLRAYQWFLDRASDDGIPLTSAGYLKPADVAVSTKVVPAMGDWPDDSDREVHCPPLLEFRQSLQSLRLLRKHKNALLLTKAGSAAQRDPAALWDHLARRLVPADERTFEGQASLLLLAYAGGSEDGRLLTDKIAAALTELDWRHGDGEVVRGYDLYRLPAHTVLVNVSDKPRVWADRARISPAASALARAALRRRA
ncbi:plasmid pRiA4b ORF-3 family protein [Mycobacterium sp. GA-1285]|uniref:plasmid pRiA4b ORF-3 family protein n=1 Tax=Mycobacterium sp. GA-1285 TaxID=1772282 RepID=UPI0020A43F17|nr:plasmid pRiA4b ORF-3 family protein [Mycobacterium sp. GA-1285]